jgi:rhomboid family GlyGly-CTERM serine protease
VLPLTLSRPERVATALALAVLVLHALGTGDLLEYRVDAVITQPWRGLTGHLVHVSWAHALVNAAGLIVVARLYAEDLDVRRQVSTLLLSAVAITAVLAVVYPTITWYRGLSGALHGLFFAGAAKWLISARPRSLRRLWLPALLLLGGWLKVMLEQPDGAGTPHADWLGAAVVPQSHLAGAVCGTALGALFAATYPRREQQRRKQ